MEFLVDAIFRETTSRLCGMNIVSFDPDKPLERPVARVMPLDEFHAAYPSMEPYGFKYNAESGVIVSDTPARRSLVDEVATYVMQDTLVTGGRMRSITDYDITDVVLWGLEVQAAVCANWEEVQTKSDEPILIPFKRFRVAKTSFNIYAAYQKHDDTFATYSLVSPIDGSAEENVIFVPVAAMDQFGVLVKHLVSNSVKVEDLGETKYDGSTYKVLRIVVGLHGFSCNVGEGFTNYLSYNVTNYDIGNQIITDFISLGESNTAGTVRKAQPNTTAKRRPKYNVAVEHIYSGVNMIKEVLPILDDIDKLRELLEFRPEAAVAASWLETIVWSQAFQSTLKKNDVSAALQAGAMSLQEVCKVRLLAFNCQLLSMRYFLHRIGAINCPFDDIISGGGVPGESRIVWQHHY